MKRKKLKYVPGLISLIGLPLWLLLVGIEEPQYKNSMRLFLPRDEPLAPGILAFTKHHVFASMKDKNITTIEFWDDHRANEVELYRHISKLKFVKKEIQRMAFTYDSSSVLKIEMGNGMTYGEFIWVLDQFQLFGIRRYALVDFSLIAFPNELSSPPSKRPGTIIVETGLPGVVDNPISWWDETKRELEKQLEILHFYVKYNYGFIAGFILLIVIPFFLRIKKYRHFNSLRENA